MSFKSLGGATYWSVVIPVIAIALLFVAPNHGLALWVVVVVAASLIAAVVAAVHHAEVGLHAVVRDEPRNFPSGPTDRLPALDRCAGTRALWAFGR